MKSLTSLLFVGLLLFLTSCAQEFVTPENNNNCTMNFQNHPNATSFQALADQYANDGFVGMTLLIDDPSNGLWIGASGFASIEEDVAMNSCHIHHTASLYKTYIATVIMQLVAENKMDLNDKLSDYLSLDITDKIPNGNVVSIKNLLQQRTGIPDIFEVEFVTDFFNNPTKSYAIEELLEYIYDKKPLSGVDKEFHYSDANFSLLTLVIQEVEGNYIEALKSRIFEPLNLEDTYFLENTNDMPVGLADSYWNRYGDGKIENNSDVQIALTAGLRGSDGVLTTANDLKIFIQALAEGRLVQNISLMTDFLDVPLETQEREVYGGYGMGLMKVNINGAEWYGHFGNQIGSGAIVLYNADKEITIVALQNTGTFFSDEIKGKFFYQLLNDIEGIVL